MTDSPKELDWVLGPLPAVETVPYDCIVVLWSESYIGLVVPHSDSLNPLRWCDDGYLPRWGITPPEGWWVWLRAGSASRPPEVKTWAEKHETPEILAWDRHRDACEQCRLVEDGAMRRSFTAAAPDTRDYLPDLCIDGQVLAQAMRDAL